MKKLLFIFLFISSFCFAQNSMNVKALYSGNTQDTTSIKNTLSSLQALYGIDNYGGLYWNNVSHKWRIWIAACTACSVDSTWIDLPINAGASGLVSADNGLSQSPTSNVELGGSPLIKNTLISHTGLHDLYLGPSIAHSVFSTSNGMEFVSFGNDSINAPDNIHTLYKNLSNSIHHEYKIAGSTVLDQTIVTNGRLEYTMFTNSGAGFIYNSNLGEMLRLIDSKLSIAGAIVSQASLTMPSGTANASSAPIKMTPGGILMTTPESMAIEVTNSHIYWTDNSGTRFQLDQQGGGGSPGGANTNVQFNNSASFGGSSKFTWDGTKIDVNNGGSNDSQYNAGLLSLTNGTNTLTLNSLSATLGSSTSLLISGVTAVQLGTSNAGAGPTTVQNSGTGDLNFTSAAGGTGDIKITGASGSGSFIILSGLPASCSGAPTGSLANVAGVLTICP